MGQTSPFERLVLDDLSAFQSTTSNWQVVSHVIADPHTKHAFEIVDGTGVLINNQSEEAKGHLFTAWSHADLELDLEVLMPVESNSGIYFQSRYEIQLFDSWGANPVQHSDMGGIYQRWDENQPDGQKGFEGHAPQMSVARAPGLWQHLNVLFRAPRFDETGQKIEPAKFIKVTLNGVVIHENVELSGPTRASTSEDETASAPLMIQGDHGPVAFRNVKYRMFDSESVELNDVNLAYYRGLFNHEMPDLGGLKKLRDESVSVLTSQVADTTNLFVIEYSGTLNVPKTGTYVFEVSHTSRVRLEINNQEVLTDRSKRVSEVGEFPRNIGQMSLSRGNHSFRLTYAKGLWHRVPTVLGWYVTGPGLLRNELTAPGSVPEDAYSAFRIVPGKRPNIQRNFVVHRSTKRTHAMSVGYPKDIHYSYDMSRGALLHVWKGPFVDTSTMWYQRGNMQSAVPLGSVVERSGLPSIAFLDDQNSAWPDSLEDYTFRNYRLNEAGEPVFSFEIGEIDVEDHITPDSDRQRLTRTLRISGDINDKVWVLLVESSNIEHLDARSYLIDDQQMYVEVDEVNAIEVRTSNGRDQLLVKVPPSSNEVREVSYTMIW